MATSMQAGGHARGLFATQRVDDWKLEPLLTGGGFLLFALYTTWAAFQGTHYYSGHYLSPYYSPLFFVKTGVPGGAPIEHAWFGAWPAWWPEWLPASPALWILLFPLLFRMTCYYYRKFYYRAYFLSPPACAVGAIPQKTYTGETGLLVIQNIHRYALYIAVLFIFFLSYDALMSFGLFAGDPGIGLGSIILTVNPVLLGLYTFGCHALRHVAGGNENCFSCETGTTGQHRAWSAISWMNHRHMQFALVSMYWVMLADLYVRLVSMGVITDLNTWGH